MRGRRLELSGQRFGRLTVTSFAGTNERRNSTWHCRCDCGNETVLVGNDLVAGDYRSCGCRKYSGGAHYADEALAARFATERAHTLAYEAKREREWLAQRGQRRERVA